MRQSDVAKNTAKKAEMHRWFVVVVTLIVPLAAILVAPEPRALAGDAPIGRIGDTLRVDYDDPAYGRVVADVAVHEVLPAEIPPGWGYNGSPRWRFEGTPWRSEVTVHTVRADSPSLLSLAFSFNGVTPLGDSYVSKHTDDTSTLDYTLTNAPAGSTVNGGVYWDVYRDPITNVVLLDKTTGHHLAQWNP
jgi:hypothetical protein